MNYFEYFTEIEDRFTARRGSILLLSTLDWALIETWREAEIPLAAVLRGIDTAFDRYDARKLRAKNRIARVNGLAWCAQAVLDAAAELAEANTGALVHASTPVDTGFEVAHIANYLEINAKALDRACEQSIRQSASASSMPCNEEDPVLTDIGWRVAAADTANRLRVLAAEARSGLHPALDQLDRLLTVLEERLQAAVLTGTSEPVLLHLRETADRELAAAKINAAQRRLVRDSFIQKRLFETHKLPRLSLFYMPIADGPEAKPDATPHRPSNDAAA